MQTFFKILALVFTLLFLWATFLQFNDSDPYIWITVYGISALASVAFIFNKLHIIVAAILSAIYLIAGFSHWPDTYEGTAIKEVGLKNVHEGREAIGLLLCGIILLLYALRIWFKKKRDKESLV